MKQLTINFDECTPRFEIKLDVNALGTPSGICVNPEEVHGNFIAFDIDRYGVIREHMLTPGEFATRMRELGEMYKDDEELCHVYMDELMCKVLRDKGFGKGVDVFDETAKWYS